MVNGKKIKERCRELGMQYQDLCGPLGIKPITLYKKLSGKRSVTTDEADIMQKVLKIPDEEYVAYFLNRDID